MTSDVFLAYSRNFPSRVDDAFGEVLTHDLARLFDRRHAAFPPIKGVRDQIGVWGTPGQTRTIALADGGSMRETLTEVDRPGKFAYVISDITGPMRPLIAGLDGAWSFEPSGAGVQITWSWRVRPAGRLGALTMPVFRRMWKGYARKGFDNIEQLLRR